MPKAVPPSPGTDALLPALSALSSLGGGIGAGLAQLEALFDELPDVVFFVKDTEGRYVLVNQTLAARCARGDKLALIGRQPRDVFPSELARHYERQDAATLQGQVWSHELELHVYPGGSTGWCLSSKRPLYGSDGKVCGIAGISRDLNAPSRKSQGYAELAGVIRHMQTHFAESLRIESLAQMAGLTVYQFEQRIQRLFQMTPLLLLHKLRIEEATRLLKSEMSLSEIAQAAGYCDQSAFTRHFSKFTGITPGRFRQMHR